jgi:hypothetical protein
MIATIYERLVKAKMLIHEELIVKIKEAKIVPQELYPGAQNQSTEEIISQIS